MKYITESYIQEWAILTKEYTSKLTDVCVYAYKDNVHSRLLYTKERRTYMNLSFQNKQNVFIQETFQSGSFHLRESVDAPKRKV